MPSTDGQKSRGVVDYIVSMSGDEPKMLVLFMLIFGAIGGGIMLSRSLAAAPGPIVPPNFRTSSTTETTVSLTWDASIGKNAIRDYRIFRDGNRIATVSASVTSYTDTGRTPNTTYAYQIRASDVNNKYSAMSSILYVTTAASSPTPPTDTDGDGLPDSDDGCPTVAGPESNNGCPLPAPPSGPNPYSMRFYGNGINDIDRVKIPLTTNKTIDVSGNFTLEWWMKTASGNDTGTCAQGNDSWIYGNILFDRDIYGGGDYGDYGISLFGNGGRLNFGVTRGSSNGTSVCSTISVADGLWHHVAATRNTSSGQLCFYIDGVQSGCTTGPTGDISYRDGRSTGYPNSDPYLVFGAEKHDAGSQFPSYHGWLDEVRISNNVRYTSNFTRPTSAFTADTNTVALYHFNEGSGTVLQDVTNGNNGLVKTGGNPTGPFWSTDKPF